MKGDEDASASAADRARARLDKSRLAILGYLQQTRGDAPAPNPQSTDTGSTGSRSQRWAHLRARGRRYWERHPASLATRLLTPALSFWGRRHPVAFIAIGLGVGALLMLARPWRLISVTGVALAALKSPHLASLAMSALASLSTRARDSDRPPA